MLATERTATGRFPPGRSGNPAGRPPGARNKSTLALEDALAARSEDLVDALLRSARDGKGAALRICFDRLAPLRKGRPVPFELPPLACHDDVVAAAAQIVMGMADGELTPAEAQDIFKVLEAFAKVLTSPARLGQAPPVAAEASRQPQEPEETCKSPESEAGAANETAEAIDPVPMSPVTPDPAPPAAAEASRQPQEPEETCKSSESGAGAANENAEVLDPAPASPVTPDPPPPVADEASRQPQEPAETCKLPGSADEAGGENAEHSAASKPAGTSAGALASGTERIAFGKAREADRGDRLGAGLRLVRLGEAVGGEPMSEHHVRALFDQRAQRFEAELAGLGYRGAQLLRRAVETVAGAGVRFERMIDLGCGTGLAATGVRCAVPHRGRHRSLAGHDRDRPAQGPRAAGHVSAALDAAGLAGRVRDPPSVRHEGGIAVPGLIVVTSPARPPPGWAGRGVRRGRG